MPRENRKRGKKHKKPTEGDQIQESYHNGAEEDYANAQNVVEQPVEAEPSWMRSVDESNQNHDSEAPFGYLDADVKAYFRTADVQMRDWQDTEELEEGEQGVDADADPNEKKRMFFMAALTEMNGKEKQLATDPDCSVILERMLYSMDDFVRRIFMDSLFGSYETLARHRFASHVVQMLFTLMGDTVAREMRGVLPQVPESSEQGELRTITQLVLDACEEFSPSFSSLLLDPFASHVTRALLLLLSGIRQTNQSAVRSKKSAAWKARQGAMKSMFSEDISQVKGTGTTSPVSVPPEFRKVAGDLVMAVRKGLGENEVRALAASKVASPSLQMLLEVEADQNLSDESGSLLDTITAGVISYCRNGSTAPIEPSDYLNTLLRDTTSSHLLETVISRCPSEAFTLLWKTYLEGKLSRLALHPVANFVVAKALERVNEEQLQATLTELDSSFGRLIKSSRVGVIRVMLERSATLKVSGGEICQALHDGFELGPDSNKLVPCALTLLPLPEYTEQAERISRAEERQKHQHSHKKAASQDPLEPKVQGALLLQSLLKLPEPHHELVINSILSLPILEQTKLAHHSVSSRILDALLESPSVPSKIKRNFVLSWIGHYHEIVNDRIGSRVVDRCWDFADTYMKEKIARSLIPHDTFLAGSYYGKFFARRLNLYLLQRKPDEWRNLQASRKVNASNMPARIAASNAPKSKPTLISASGNAALEDGQRGDTILSTSRDPKRKRNLDEIDDLFQTKLGKKVKRAALSGDSAQAVVREEGTETVIGTEDKDARIDAKGLENAVEKSVASYETKDHSLQDVFSAIRSAPKSEGKSHNKRVKKKH